MFVYKSRFLTRAEVWFDETPDEARVDWIYHRQRSSPLARCQSKPFNTRLIDLRKAPAELLAEMDERTARKITEAQEKDRLTWEHCDPKDPRTMDAVEQMWNEFAASQKTPLFERGWVDRIAEAGGLELTAATDLAGNRLAYHLVFITRKRARQVIAISPHRAVPDVAWRGAVSRANCFIHWKNFLAWKAQGIPCFDFGGWYTGTTNMQLLGINRFKKSFGGSVVQDYDCEQPVTVKGWILLKAAEMLARARQARTRNGAASESKLYATTPEDHQVSPAIR